jgi:hypothetical protein
MASYYFSPTVALPIAKSALAEELNISQLIEAISSKSL